MKKGKKLTITIVAVILVLWASMFLTDYIRCTKLDGPVFAVASVTADDGGSGVYKGLGYTVEIEKHVDAQYGAVTDSVEMRLFGIMVFAAIV